MEGLPWLGAGLGYRPPIHQQICDNSDAIDWLEVVSDNFIPPLELGGLDRALALRKSFRIVPHSLEMSVGSSGDLDSAYLYEIGRLATAVEAPWFSDHLCYTHEGGVALGSLIPVRRSARAALAVAEKAQRVQSAVGLPFLLENITYYVDPQGELSESEFLSMVLENCDCGLLLDLTNVAVNSRNHGFDALGFLRSIPLERVIQVHLAGGEEEDGEGPAMDTHSSMVPDQVWELLDYVSRVAPLKGVLIERDQNFPPDFQDLLDEVAHARQLMLSGMNS